MKMLIIHAKSLLIWGAYSYTAYIFKLFHIKKMQNMKSKVLGVVNTKIMVFWHVMPCILVGKYKYFYPEDRDSRFLQNRHVWEWPLCSKHNQDEGEINIFCWKVDSC
jgi:hypothetical protein